MSRAEIISANNKAHYMGRNAREPVFVGLRTTQAQTSLRIHADWSAPLLFVFWKVSYLNLLGAKFQLPSSLCSWAGWFESHFVGNPEDRFGTTRPIYANSEYSEHSAKTEQVDLAFTVQSKVYSLHIDLLLFLKWSQNNILWVWWAKRKIVQRIPLPL